MPFAETKVRDPRMTRHEYRIFMSRLKEVQGPLDTPCLIWTSTTNRGYGTFNHRRAHIVYWQHVNKQFVPAGKELAHECKTKLCVRHVRPLTHKENLVEDSGKEYSKECSKGHKMTPENTYIQPGRPSNRVCKKCRAIRERDRDRRKRLGG
jgi:hypothetical protein